MIRQRKTKSGAVRYQVILKSHGAAVCTRTFETESAAKRFHMLESVRLADCDYVPERGRTSMGDVITIWLSDRGESVAETTLATDKYVMQLLPEFLNRRQVRSISSGDLQRLISTWGRDGKSAATVSRYADSIRAFFSWAHEHGFTPHNPMDKVNVRRGGTELSSIRPLSEAEILQLADNVGGLNGDIVAFLGLTGLRWGEARALVVSDLRHVEGRTLVDVVRSQSEGFGVKSPKNGRSRVVPVSPAIVERTVERTRGKKADDYLLSVDGNSQIWRGTFVRQTNWGETAGGRSIHDLRHSAATNWLGRGVPVNLVMSWMGHSDLSQVTRYSSWAASDIDMDIYRKLGG